MQASTTSILAGVFGAQYNSAITSAGSCDPPAFPACLNRKRYAKRYGNEKALRLFFVPSVVKDQRQRGLPPHCRVSKIVRLGKPKQALMDRDTETVVEARQR